MNIRRQINWYKCQQKTWQQLVIFTIFLCILYIIAHRIAVKNHSEKPTTQEIIKLISHDPKYAEIIRRPDKLRKGTKYLLLWTSELFYPFYALGNGHRKFIERHCPEANCYVTSDKKFFDGSLEKFHAVAFNSRNLRGPIGLPKTRTSNQIYIFFGTESSDNYPICSDVYDGYFNWTSTYRLDSDIPWLYFQVLDKEGMVVGPRQEMHWIDNMDGRINEVLMKKINKKKKLAAWFVSNCSSRSYRREYVDELQQALQRYNTSVDIYGYCGTKKCPKGKKKYCLKMLQEEYFFYLAFENSFAEDYVSEKVVDAFQNYMVPVVFGGANYTRFLPPGSYLDARAQSPTDLAHLMHTLSHSPKIYSQYFRWRNHYSFALEPPNACDVCKALNDKSMVGTKKVYENLRSWWNPDYRKRCNFLP